MINQIWSAKKLADLFEEGVTSLLRSFGLSVMQTQRGRNGLHIGAIEVSITTMRRMTRENVAEIVRTLKRATKSSRRRLDI